MQAIGQNIAVGAALLFLAAMVLRQIPVLGFFFRLATRALFLVSPLMLIVLVVGVAWFHGAALFRADGAPTRAAEPVPSAMSPSSAPLPPERPR